MSGEALDKAVMYLQRGELENARSLIQSVIDHTPDNAEALSLLGLALPSEQGELALKHLNRAIELDPAEPQFKLNLAGMLLKRDEVTSAEILCRVAVEQSRGAPAALLALASCLERGDKHFELAQVYTALAQQQPQNLALQRKRSEALFASGNHVGAYEAYIRSLEGGEPQNVTEYLALSRFALTVSDFHRASILSGRALEIEPGNTESILTAARIALFLGDLKTAKAHLEDGLAGAPDHQGLLYLALDILKPPPDDVLERALKVAATTNGSVLNFALARHFDKAGDFDTAWHWASRANAQQDLPVFDVTEYEAQLDIALNLFKQCKDLERAATELSPIYLLGSPRSGGSLLETILSADPGVGSTGERGALLPWLRQLLNTRSVSATDADTSRVRDHLAALANADISGIRSVGVSEHAIIDKTPANAEIAGLLSLVHPEARFVDMDRDARDTALSIFMHEFPHGFAYSNDLNSIRTYLGFRREAVQKWTNAGVDIIQLQYEAFVSAPAEAGQDLFQRLDLMWKDDLLKPEFRNSPVRTFSANAVRQPVQNKRVGRWQNYSKHFDKFEP